MPGLIQSSLDAFPREKVPSCSRLLVFTKRLGEYFHNDAMDDFLLHPQQTPKLKVVFSTFPRIKTQKKNE